MGDLLDEDFFAGRKERSLSLFGSGAQAQGAALVIQSGC